MAQNSAQQFAFCIVTVFRVFLPRVRGGLDRRPGRNPERTHAAALFKNLGNVPALGSDGDPYRFIFNRQCAAVMELRFAHSMDLTEYRLWRPAERTSRAETQRSKDTTGC